MYFFLYRKKTLQIIFFFVINFGVVDLISGIARAQSLLSDRAWLMQNLENFEKIEDKSLKTPILPSDLFFSPITSHKQKYFTIDNDFSSHSFSTKNYKNSLIPLMQKEYRDRDLSGSLLMRFFPWFSSQGVYKKVNSRNYVQNNKEKSELANTEFSGIFFWIKYIQELLEFDPDKARLKFLEIEEKLNIDERTLLKVQLFYFLKEWDKAENLAEIFLRERADSIHAPVIFYYLNKSYLSQGKQLSKNRDLRNLTIKFLEPKLRSDFLKMLSDEAMFKGNPLRALEYLLVKLENKQTSQFSEKNKIVELLREVKSLKELQNLSKNYPNLIWLQEKIILMQIELFIKKKLFREALDIVENKLKHSKEIVDEETIEFLIENQKRLSKALKTNPKRIGVILPLSSSNEKISRLAQETLNGLWTALHAIEIYGEKYREFFTQNKDRNSDYDFSKSANIFNSSTKNRDSWELVVRDSALSAEVTRNVIFELVETEKVIAIIGPLARKTSEAAAEVAERLKVPLISLSLTDSIPSLGDYIFRNNQSWKQEVIEILDYAVSELQACRFIILFAMTREGRQKMRHFWDETIKRDCEIVAVEGFKDEGQRSLVNEFDTFTGKNLRMSFEEKNILKELKEKEDPVHNFDAVFVAVGAGGVKNLRLILPYSSVYKLEKTTFLGDSGWNDLALQFAPGLKGVRNPIFVDSFFLSSKTLEMELLLNLHERILYRHQNYIGPTAYTAYAYDTLMILLNLLKEDRNHNHEGLRDALINMKPFSGVTGNLRFDKNGEMIRKMQLLTLRRGEIKLLFKPKKQ